MSRTGLNVEFVSADAFNRSDVNALYSRSANKIYINAEENSKTFDELIVHETAHALYTDKNIRKVIDKMAEKLTDEERREIRKTYSESLKGKSLSERTEIMQDEFGAHYLEDMLGKEGMLNALLAEEQTVADKLSAFIKGAETAYRADKHLAPATKRVFNAYKKALQQFSESNKGMNAYSELIVDKEGDGGRFAIQISKDNTPFVIIEDDILTGVAENEWIKTVKNNLSARFPNGVALGKNIVAIDRQTRKELTYSKYMQWLKNKNPQAFSDKLRATNNIDEILNATQDWISEGLNHPRTDKIIDFARGDVLLRIGKNDYSASVIVGTQKNGKMKMYDIIDLKPTRIIKKETSEAIPGNSSRRAERKTTLISDNSISQSSEKINPSDKISSKISVEDGRASVSAKTNPYTEYDKPITAADIDVLRTIPRKSINEFTSEEIQKTQKWAHKFYKELGTKSPFFRAWFGDWRSEDKYTNHKTTAVSSIKASSKDENVLYVKQGLKDHSLFRGDVKNTDTNFNINIGSHVYNDTLTYATRELSRRNDIQKFNDKIALLTEIREIVEKSILLDSSVINDNDTADRTFMHYFYSIAKVQDRAYLVKLGVDELNATRGTIRRAYNVDNIKISPIAVSQVYKPADTIGDGGDLLSTYSISDLFEIVKRYDPEFKPKPVNPLLLNSDGTPKVFYHGTNAEFNTFEKRYKRTRGRLNLGKGFYFAANRSYAENYIEKNGRIIGAYINVKKPYIVIGNQFTEFELNDIRSKLSAEDGAKLNYDNANEYLAKLGYDGIFAYDYKGTSKVLNSVVAFEANQIKSATDNIGTFDKGNPDIRFSLSTPSSITGQTPSFVDPAAKSVTLQSSKYKSTFNERKSDAWTAIQMNFTNAQAGVERLMRDVGISQPDAEAMVQYTRLANAQANNLIGGKFIDIRGNANTLVKKGKRLRGCQIKN